MKPLARYFRISRHRQRRWLPVSFLRWILRDRKWTVRKPAPTLPEIHETGIGIIRPVVDAPVEEPTAALTFDGAVVCGSTFELDKGFYECELNSGHDGDHSACGDDPVTWPREAVGAVAQ